MVGRLAGLAGNINQSFGITAAAAANDNDGVHGFCQALNFCLATLGRIANRLKNFIVRLVFSRPFFDRMPEVGVERCLSDDDCIFKTGKCFELIHIFGDKAFIPAIAPQTDHFGMVFVADDNGCKSFFQVFFYNRLHLDYPRAGCIDNLEARFFKLIAGLRWYAMGPDEHRARALRRRFIESGYAFFF